MTRNATLEGVDGSLWDLTAGPLLFAGRRLQVYGMVPVQLTERSAALIPGSRVDYVRHGARDIVIPVVIVGDEPDDVEETLADLARAIDPVQGEVRVTHYRDDGTQRWLTGRYVAGLEMLGLELCTSREVTAALAIRAYHPYWRTYATPITVEPPPATFGGGTTDTNAADVGVNDPIPVNGYVTDIEFSAADIPFNALVPFSGGASSTVLTTVTNPGDVDAWPVFTIVGPATAIEATNATTGKTWSLETLATGAQLIIDTTPGQRAVTVNGANAYGRLADGSSLWALPPGDSQVIIRFAGTGPNSTFQLAFEERYLTC